MGNRQQGKENPGVKQVLFVIRELTDREIKRKYTRSTLGIIWSVLQPLLNMLVISLVFSTMFQRNIENFPIYYLTGSVFFNLFSGSTTSAISGLVDNKNLLIRTKLPKSTFVLSRVYTALVNLIYTSVAYLLMLFVFGIQLRPMALLYFIDVFFEILFCIGLSLILATLYVFFADIKYLYGVFVQLITFLSAIFYPVERLPEFMQIVIGENPVYQWILFARTCVMQGEMPQIGLWFRIIIWSLIMFLLGIVVFRFNENKVMQVV